ncbi:MAG: glycoside hydrolase family 3 N-terminal domain-containing protein [Flavobacteriales bacterium]
MRIIPYTLSILMLLALTGQHLQAQQPCFRKSPTPWADSVFSRLTQDQKIGQLFMAAAWSDPTHTDYNPTQISNLIRDYHIGGLIFMQGSPGRQAQLTNRFQQQSDIPLMLAMDAEWGLGMRLDSTIAYPRQLTLGATGNDSLIYSFGTEMARQLKRMGVHVSFSPVVDINNNPRNPVISNRSFGENTHQVTEQSLMYMKGLQDHGVLACAKHFPGHGDTDTDSHKALPTIEHDYLRLDSVELFPYHKLIAEGLGSVMTAHLYVPALDSTMQVCSTISEKVINGLLRDTMQFDGLVFTDAMNMQGIAKYHKEGNAEVLAIKAGVDILLFTQDIPQAIGKIKAAIDSGFITQHEIDMHCYRVLQAKEWAGAHLRSKTELNNLYEDLNNPAAQNLHTEIVERSLTLARNNKDLLPLNNIYGKRIAIVCVGEVEPNMFESTLSHYMQADVFYMEKNPEFKKSMWWRDTLSTYDRVIAGLMNTSNKASKNFGVSNESARILNSAAQQTDVVLTLFANPYSLDVLKDLSNIESLVVAYQDEPKTHRAAAELITGVVSAGGMLPVSANDAHPFHTGICTKPMDKLRWETTDEFAATTTTSQTPGSPAGDYEEDMMADKAQAQAKKINAAFSRIDAIAQSGIAQGAYPGCRVLVAVDGVVAYDKAFGTHSYGKSEKVELNTVYDLASITKVASSTLACMRLADQDLLDVNLTLGDYLDIPADNAYNKVVIKNMLSHCAGFTPWIPFYSATIADGQLDAAIYTTKPDSTHTMQVCDQLYILDSYRDSIFQKIISTPLSTDRSYKYSDLGYYFIQRIVEKQTGQTLDQFMLQNFYTPMGLGTIGYQPLQRMDAENIAPTENDKSFRNEHLRGHVHDQGAAMMGGVAGHAGLFSNAQDLAAIMQMLLDSGHYAGRQYISAETIALFNTRHFSGNRRGLGFDKPSLSPGHGSTCRQASATSFGHTGFTGTMCWADPAQGIVYIFLSNRVCPDAENKKLQDLDIRTSIQEEIYKAIGSN